MSIRPACSSPTMLDHPEAMRSITSSASVSLRRPWLCMQLRWKMGGRTQKFFFHDFMYYWIYKHIIYDPGISYVMNICTVYVTIYIHCLDIAVDSYPFTFFLRGGFILFFPSFSNEMMERNVRTPAWNTKQEKSGETGKQSKISINKVYNWINKDG